MAAASGRCGEETETLLRGVDGGDDRALGRLLSRYRSRLRRMVARRTDPRVAARFDPSDIVQEALADAAGKLGRYLKDRPLPFYPWLCRLAAERLAQFHRRHLGSRARSVGREVPGIQDPRAQSSWQLAGRLVAEDNTPGRGLVRAERHQALHLALGRLSDADRRVLVLRYIDQLPFAEIAANLGIGEGAATMRHLRALQRLRVLFEGTSLDGGSCG